MAARVSICLCFFFTLVAFQSAHADCLRESSGQTVCGQGPCDKDRSGTVFVQLSVTALPCGTSKERLFVVLVAA